MIQNYKYITTLLVLAFGLAIASAQENEVMEDINVNSSLYSLLESSEDDKSETVSEDEIEQILAQSIDDILRVTPSATTAGGPRSSSESIQVRGLTSNKLFTYVDGVRQNFSTDHSSMLAIDTESLKKVEVFKSTSSFSNGSSIGGGVSFTTKDASDYLSSSEISGATFKTSYQESNKENSISAKSYSNIDGDQLLLSASTRKSDDVILGDRRTLPHSSYTDFNTIFKYSFKGRANEEVKISADVFQRNDNVPLNPTLNPPKGLDSLNGTSQTKRITTNLQYKFKSKSNRLIDLHSNLYSTSQTQSKERKSDSRTESRRIITQGASLKNNSILNIKKVKRVVVLSGIESVNDTLSGNRNDESLPSYPGGKSSVHSVFTELNISPNTYTEIDLGLRLERYSLQSDNLKHKNKKSNNISKMAALTLTPIKGLSFTGSYSEGFNAPKIQEVYVDGEHHPGSWGMKDNNFIPNPSLNHETSKTYEVGSSFETNLFDQEDLLKISAHLYWNDIQDYIHFISIDRSIFEEEDATTQLINMPLAETFGREFSLSYLYDQYEFSATFTQNRGYNRLENIYISSMPADQYSFNLKYYLDDQGVSMGYLGIKALDQSRVNPQTTERTDATPGYFTHSIFLNKNFLSGKLRGIGLSARVDNLTNRRYRKHFSNIMETGRDFKISLSYKL